MFLIDKIKSAFKQKVAEEKDTLNSFEKSACDEIYNLLHDIDSLQSMNIQNAPIYCQC